MILITKVRQAGKRRNFLVEKELVLFNTPKTLQDLLGAVVDATLEEYHSSLKNDTLLHYLTESEISEAAEIGKVSFGEVKNKTEQNREEAIQNALDSFQDGLYFVLINGEKIENLDTELSLHEGDEVLFIRLVMLAGRMW